MTELLNGLVYEVNVSFNGTPTDITDDVVSVQITRGRSRQLDQMTAGTCTITVRNDTRKYDPFNTASATGSTTRPRMPVLVRAGHPIAAAKFFTGYVEDVLVDWDRTNIGTVTYRCVDAFSVLANQVMAPHTASEQLSGARVSAVLDRPEVDWSFGNRNIDTGVATLQADTVAAGTNVLNYLHRIAQAEQGRIFIDRIGRFTFRDRYDTLTSTVNLKLYDSEAAAGATGTVYQTYGVEYGTVNLYNRVETQRVGGTIQTAEDTASQAEYLIRTLSYTDLLNVDDQGAADVGQMLLSKYADPELRIREVSFLISYANLPAANDAIDAEPGDVVEVTRTFDTGTPTTDTRQVAIEQISHDITPERHRVTFRFGSTDGRSFMVLDNATLGRLDYNLLAF